MLSSSPFVSEDNTLLDLHDFTDHTHPYPIIPSYFDKIKDRIIVIVWNTEHNVQTTLDVFKIFLSLTPSPPPEPSIISYMNFSLILLWAVMGKDILDIYWKSHNLTLK